MRNIGDEKQSPSLTLRVCLNPKNLHKKTSHQMFGHMHEVLNRIYLQNFLHEWVVNREMI